MMASSELSSNQERLVDALIANLHSIYFCETYGLSKKQKDVTAKRTIDIAVEQAGKDAVYSVLRTTMHKQLRDFVAPLLHDDQPHVAPSPEPIVGKAAPAAPSKKQPLSLPDLKAPK